jgi:predicted permease
MALFLDDLRAALLSLRSAPGFVGAVVLTLALGIGANTAIFSVVNGMLLQPLPYPDGERLVQVYNVYPKSGLDYAGTSIPDFLDRREQAPALEDLALYHGASFNLAEAGTPERLTGLRTTPSLFTTLGIGAASGRVFNADEAKIGEDRVVVLSHDLWQHRFTSDPDIVGRDLRLNGESYRVVGVMPAGFAFPNRDTELWVPFAFTPEQMSDEERGNEFSESIGRLRTGATAEQLNAQLDVIVQRNAERFATMDDPRAQRSADFFRNGGFLGRAHSLREQWLGSLGAVLVLLQAVVGFVLLIACANVANLMLTRVLSRQNELSLRSALGAAQSRIARQLLLEALLLSLAGAATGIGFAFLGLQLLGLLGLDQSQLSEQIRIDGPVLLFTLGVAVATALLFGLLPVVTVRSARPYEALKEGGRSLGGGKRARYIRNTLVVAQVALAVTLLAGAGLLIRSFAEVSRQDTGFASQGRLTARISLPESRYAEPEDQARFYERALAELRAIPGVRQVSYVSNLPFGELYWTSSYRIEGREVPAGEPSPHGYGRIVDEGFFAAMEIPVLRGRAFTPADIRGRERVVIIDELLARKHFPDGETLGKRICRQCGDDPEWWTVIGVVGTVKVDDLADEVTKESYYFSYRQFTYNEGFFVIASDLPAGSLIEPMREAVLRVDPEQPLYDIKSLDDRIRVSMDGRQTPMVLLALFAGLAVLLSAIGIYGLLAFGVEQRTSEFGVRMALGARRTDIMGMVLGQTARIALAGLAIGLVASLLLNRFLQAQLYGVEGGDPLNLAVVSLALVVIALAAGWFPARRAARVQALEALRYE